MMHKNMTRIVQLLASASTVSLLAGAAMADVVKIGVLAPLTGATASDGEEFVRGVTWAVEEANAKGGVAGHTFEIEVADVKDHSAANVSSAVERLLGTDGVEVIVTGYASLSMFEVELMAEENMPYIAAGPSPGFMAITSQDPEYYNCCWSFTASFTGYETDVLPMVEALGEDGEITIDDKTVAIISSDNPYSKTISEGMKASFEEGGWDIVVDELVPFGDVNDWKVILAKVNETNPDLVVNTDYLPGNSALFLNQFLENPSDSLVFLQYAPSVPEFLELTGEKANGVIYNLIGGNLDTPKWPHGQEMVAAYKARFGMETGTYGVGLYEMTNISFDALEKVGDPTDHDAIGKALGETNKMTASGNIEFDPETHVALQDDDHVPVTFWQLWDGERAMIKPDAYANGEFRLPPWMSAE